MPQVYSDAPRITTTTPSATSPPMAAALANAAVQSSLLPNIHAATAPFPHEFVSPGSIYAGQWNHDSAKTSVVACAFGYATHAATWLSNWPAFQVQSGVNAGQLPINVATGGAAEYRVSQIPHLAWAAWTVYQQTQDQAALATLYAMLKLAYAWWERTHQDATGLAAWGHTAPTGAEAADRDVAKLESGQDQCGPYQDGQWILFDQGTKRMRYADPSLNGALVAEANYLSLIAGILGNSADQATYATKRDARKAAMNAYLWDATQGCYQHLLMADFAPTLGTVGAALAAGATAVPLAAATTIPLDKGQLLDFGNGTTAQSLNYVAAGAASVALLAPLPAAVAAGATIKARAFVATKSLGSIALPLWAGVPSQAQAEAMANAHLTKSYDGNAAETTYLAFGSGRDNHVTESHVHTEWHPELTGSYTLAADGLSASPSAGQVVCSAYYRKADDPAHFLPFDATREAVGINTPLRVGAYFQGSADATVSLAIYDAAGNQVATASGPVGAGTQSMQLVAVAPTNYGAFAADAGASVPARVDVGVTAGTHAVVIDYVFLETYPRGPAFLTEHGLLAQPDRSRFSLAVPVGGNATNADTSATPFGVADYWNGDHWVDLEYMAIQGLVLYGMSADARAIATRVVARCYREYLRTGHLFERYSRRGVGHGALDYGWSGLAAILAQQFQL